MLILEFKLKYLLAVFIFSYFVHSSKISECPGAALINVSVTKFFNFSLEMPRHSLNQHTKPFILAWEFSFRSMSFYRFAVRTVPPTVLLFPWMLWEIIESAVYAAVCRSAPTSMCLVNTVSLKSPRKLPARDSSQARDVNPHCKLEPRSKLLPPLDRGSRGCLHLLIKFEFGCLSLI